MRGLAAALLIIIGALIVVVGVLYLTETAHALPSFLPGHVAYATAAKHSKRGIAAIVVGGVVAVIGIVVAATGRSRGYRW